jgi:hypothetical protein
VIAVTTLVCQRCRTPFVRINDRCPVCGAAEATRGPGLSPINPKLAEAVSFDRGESFRAVVHGSLQKPEFNSKGAALIFAQQVFCGKRPPEPVHPYRVEHKRVAENQRRMHWAWRRIRALEHCKRPGFYSSAHEAFGEQTAYCLDRDLPYEWPEGW